MMNPVTASVIFALFALLGLLVPEIACQEPKTLKEEVDFLKVRLDLMKDRYRLLCNQYANMADNCSAPAITCTECPAGWLQVGDQCFHMSTDRHNFTSSAEKCRETGAQLAMLTTREQHDAVEKEGRRIAGFHIYYWIGLSDSVTEGDWRWMDNSPLKTSFWSVHRSEPDNNQSQGPEGEDCAVVDSYTESWFDVPCEFEYPRVCQKAATPLV